MAFKMYPLYAALLSCVLAQAVKPLIHWIFTREWKWNYVLASGGMPSSHASSVAALSLAVGLVEKFNSTLFAITLVFTIIVCFDAANVRYYAGQNISLTEQLINDLKELSLLSFDDPIYEKKMKDVLGHTYFEVFFGVLLGLVVSFILYLLIY